MSAVGWTVVSTAVRTGVADFGRMYTPVTWVLGWLSRMLAQVAFFALLGTLLDDPAATRYLVVGNVAMVMVMEACFVCTSTVWERQSGTLPLLVASPTNAFTVFALRSLFWLGTGTVSSGAALLVVAPAFGVTLPVARLPAALALLVLVGASTYAFALVLGAVVMRAAELRNVLSNMAALTLMVVAGVQVPVGFWPAPVQAVSACLPLHHGLVALRGLVDGAPASSVLAAAATELLVGLCWLVVARLLFDRVLRAERRRGSIEFGAV